MMKNENYKGISISIIGKILGNKKYVAANWTQKGKKYEVKGDTKEYVLATAKQKISRILGN